MASDDVKKSGSFEMGSSAGLGDFAKDFMEASDMVVIEAETVGAEIETELAEGSFSDFDAESAFEESFPVHLAAPQSMGAKRFFAPMLVLALAAGGGGYIVTHPQLIGSSNASAMTSPMVLSQQEKSITEQLPQTMASAANGQDISETLPTDMPYATADARKYGGIEPAAGEPSSTMTPPPSPPDDAIDITDGKSNDDAMLPEPPAAGKSGGSAPIKEVNVPVPDIGASIDKQVDQSKADQAAANAPTMAGAAKSSGAGLPTGPGGEEKGVSNAPTAPVVAPSSVKPDTYYDGTAMPSGPMATQGPRKADPNMEPGSRFIIVKETHGDTDMESMVVSANRALSLGMYDAAGEMFDKLYAKNPRDPRILMGRAVAQQNNGLDDAAIHSYEELLEVKPNDADATVNMLGLIRKQYPEVALRRLMDLQDKYPSNAGIAAQIGVTQGTLGHSDDALKYLGMAASLEPSNAQHVFNMAVIADREGKTAEAVKYYEKALQVDSVYGKGRSVPRDTVLERLATLRARL